MQVKKQCLLDGKSKAETIFYGSTNAYPNKESQKMILKSDYTIAAFNSITRGTLQTQFPINIKEIKDKNSVSLSVSW